MLKLAGMKIGHPEGSHLGKFLIFLFKTYPGHVQSSFDNRTEKISPTIQMFRNFLQSSDFFFDISRGHAATTNPVESLPLKVEPFHRLFPIHSPNLSKIIPFLDLFHKVLL